MVNRLGQLFLGLVAILMANLSSPAVVSAAPPVIVLTAFGTSTPAASTYEYFEKQVKARFPGHEIRWAYTSHNVRAKLKKERNLNLKDLAQTLQELKTAGFTQVAVQSLHVVPGAEWDEVIRESQSLPGLKVALGGPLLTSPADRRQVIEDLEQSFPKDRKKTAVVLVGHGSPTPKGEAEYLAFADLLTSRFPQQNVFLGVIAGQPSREAALAKVKASDADTVVFVPLFFVAGEHISKDILGDAPESWKSELLKHKTYRIEGIRQGLGYRDGINNIYLDHLAQALKRLQ